MVAAYHNINDFVSQVKKTDLARSNRFEAMFLPPPILQGHSTTQGDSPKLISMMVEDAMFPGMLLGTRPFRVNNLNEQRANVIDFGGRFYYLYFLM